MTKCGLRREIRCRKKLYDEAALSAMSESACLGLTAHPQWKTAHTVLLYASLPDEVDTTLAVMTARQEGKVLLLPVVLGEEIALRVFSGEFAIGPFGIREPVGPYFRDLHSIDLAVIPGMAFDHNGNRLGRGRGYYDRFLPSLQAYKIGLCFPFQMVDCVPSDVHDQRVDEVISTL